MYNWNSLTSNDASQLSYVWKGIRRSCCTDYSQWSLFLSNIKFKVNNGLSISFWSDRWVDNGIMKDLFPRPFNLSRQKEASISTIFNSEWSWRRRLRLNEKRELDSMLSHMRLIISSPEQDLVCWIKHGGVYSAGSFCKLTRTAANLQLPLSATRINRSVSSTLFNSNTAGILQRNLPSPVTSSFCTAWSSFSPPQICCFIWLALHECVSSLIYLNNRNIVSDANTLCSLCKKPETQNHILMHCPFASSVWNNILRKVGISSVMPNKIDEFLLQWNSLIPRCSNPKLWHSLWDITIWELWKSRNRRIFEQKSTGIEDLVFRNFISACFYFSCNVTSFPYSGMDFFRNPDCILFH
ncbi:uncharacterized protein LOC126668243 [Mercurialis annua]|uniref:uncharacterized protein LOC126668243 n=1 Tax=Mercurialis annua TaxID=3986 RepID=UPI0021601E35|nr:uncharacterized protein LOC126668243 [Mercurialis annua]